MALDFSAFGGIVKSPIIRDKKTKLDFSSFGSVLDSQKTIKKKPETYGELSREKVSKDLDFFKEQVKKEPEVKEEKPIFTRQGIKMSEDINYGELARTKYEIPKVQDANVSPLNIFDKLILKLDKPIEKIEEGFQPEVGKNWKDYTITEKFKATLKELPAQSLRKSLFVGDGVLGTAEGILGGLQWLGVDKAKSPADKVSEWRDTATPENADFGDQLASGIGSFSTFYLPGVGVAKGVKIMGLFAPKLAMLVGGSVATLFESMTEAGDIFRNSQEAGEDKEISKSKANFVFFANAALIGLTNKLGIFNDRINSVLIRALTSAPLEGIQEFGQTMISNTAEGRPIFEGAKESGAIGTILGFFGGAGINTKSDIPIEIQEEIIKIVEEEDIAGVKPTLPPPVPITPTKVEMPKMNVITDPAKLSVPVAKPLSETAQPIELEDMPTQAIVDIKASEKPQEAITEPKAQEVVKPTIEEPLAQEARKFKTAEEFVEAVKKEPLDVGIDRKNLSEAHRIGNSDEFIIGKKTGKTIDRTVDIVNESGKKVSDRIEQIPEVEYRLVSFDKNIDDNLYNAFLRSENIVSLEEAKSQLTDIFNKAQEKSVIKKVPREPEKKPTKEPITEKGFSKHFERIKEEFGFDKGVEFERIVNKNEARKAFNFIQRNPEKALRIGYKLDTTGSTPYDQAIRQSLVVSLREAGKVEQATEIARIASKEITEAAQILNLAKLDLSPKDDIQILQDITSKRLEKLGNKLGEKDSVKAVEVANKQVKAETKKAKTEVFESQVEISKNTLTEIDNLINDIIC